MIIQDFTWLQVWFTNETVYFQLHIETQHLVFLRKGRLKYGDAYCATRKMYSSGKEHLLKPCFTAATSHNCCCWTLSLTPPTGMIVIEIGRRKPHGSVNKARRPKKLNEFQRKIIGSWENSILISWIFNIEECLGALCMLHEENKLFSLAQRWANYGPRAACSPRGHFVRPAGQSHVHR